MIISDVTVQYRGGLTMAHAVEQRQINQPYAYTSYQAAPATQSLPWLVNTFFAKNEALLPRIGWDAAATTGRGGWVDDPYNVPEMPREYPEPSNFGILPAYGLYARHVRGLTVANVTFTFQIEDRRPAVVLDDVDGATFSTFTAAVPGGTPVMVKVTNRRKRESGREYVLDQPYKTTAVTNLKTPAGLTVSEVTVDRPAPGTPPDTLYRHPTSPTDASPYAYPVPDAAYEKPRTVYRPFFDALPRQSGMVGQPISFVVSAKSVLEGATLQILGRWLARRGSLRSLDAEIHLDA